MSNQEDSDIDSRNLKITLIIRIITFVIKLGTFLLTGIIVFLADAMHSLSDIVLNILLLFGIVKSKEEADKAHMFGHGLAQNVAALSAGIFFIVFTSYKMFEEAVPRLFSQKVTVPYSNLLPAIGAGIVIMLLTAVPLLLILKQKRRGASAKAQLKDLFNDEFSTLAAIGGTLGIIWGIPLLDPIAAFLVASLIAYNGYSLAKENASFLLGRSPGEEFLKKVKEIVFSIKGVKGIHDLRAEYIGPNSIHTGMHIEVEKGLSIEKANLIREEVREKVHSSLNIKNHYCYIQIDVKHH